MTIMNHRAESLAWTAQAENEEAHAAEWEQRATETTSETRAAGARCYAALCRQRARRCYARSQEHDEAALRLALARRRRREGEQP